MLEPESLEWWGWTFIDVPTPEYSPLTGLVVGTRKVLYLVGPGQSGEPVTHRPVRGSEYGCEFSRN